MPKTLNIDLTPTPETWRKYRQALADAKIRSEGAREIYRTKIRPQLTEADKGKYLKINGDTGEFLMHDDEETLINLAYERWGANPNGLFMRVGYNAVAAFRPAEVTELAEW